MGVTKSQRVAPSLVVDPVGGDGAAVALELGAVKQEPVWSSSEAAADADEDGQLKKRSHCLACCSVRGLLEFLVVLAGLLFIALKNKGDIAIQPWGFYCSDASLQKVENGDTISPLMLLLVSILAPIILVVVNEFMVESATNGFSWRRGFRRSRGPTAVFFLAIFYTAVSTDVLKFYMSMPRPHFFQTCKPKFDEDDCLANRFITEFTCTASGSKSRIIDSQQSFPSGHASISAAAATAVIAYTVERIVCKWRQHGGLHAVRRSDGSPALGIMGINRMVPGVICVCSFVWAMVCGLSRVKDHRHHWWDVLVGAIIGVLVALISIYAAPNQTWRRNRETKHQQRVREALRSVSVAGNDGHASCTSVVDTHVTGLSPSPASTHPMNRYSDVSFGCRSGNQSEPAGSNEHCGPSGRKKDK